MGRSAGGGGNGGVAAPLTTGHAPFQWRKIVAHGDSQRRWAATTNFRPDDRRTTPRPRRRPAKRATRRRHQNEISSRTTTTAWPSLVCRSQRSSVAGKIHIQVRRWEAEEEAEEQEEEGEQ